MVKLFEYNGHTPLLELEICHIKVHQGAVHADMVGFIAESIGLVGRFETCKCTLIWLVSENGNETRQLVTVDVVNGH